MKIKPGAKLDGHTIQFTYFQEVSKGLVGIRDTEGRWNYLLECLDWKPLLSAGAWSEIFLRLTNTWKDDDDTIRTFSNGRWNYYRISDGTRIFPGNIPGMYAYPPIRGMAKIVVKGRQYPYYTFLLDSKGKHIHSFDLLFASFEEENELFHIQSKDGRWYSGSTECPHTLWENDKATLKGTILETESLTEYKMLEEELRRFDMVRGEALMAYEDIYEKYHVEKPEAK